MCIRDSPKEVIDEFQCGCCSPKQRPSKETRSMTKRIRAEAEDPIQGLFQEEGRCLESPGTSGIDELAGTRHEGAEEENPRHRHFPQPTELSSALRGLALGNPRKVAVGKPAV